jgi:hypothetical protein
MQVKDKLSQLQKNKIFTEWKKENKDSYLAHVFRMLDEANEKLWQFGYYNKDDSITTFILDENEISEIPEQEIFKKSKKKLGKLDMGKVKVSFEDALKKAEDVQNKKYKQHPIMKKIIILQTIDDGQVFNMTFVTQTFGTINIHIDSETGKVKSDKFTSLMDIARVEKGGKGKKDTEYIG